MGKVQSKQGDCFIVNAHFNPVCHQLDESCSPYHHRPSATCHDSNIPEMSLSISRDNITMNKRIGLAEDKYPLRVILPSSDCQDAVHPLTQCQGSNPSCCEEPVRPEKAEEEKSEKEENKLLQKDNISLTSSDLEKQEFSFTLYDFNGHGKVTKDDISGLVRSIYDALGKTVKLPPSGSRTIKVRLAVDPDMPTSNADPASPACKALDVPVELEEPACCVNETVQQQCPSNNLGSVHTLSTYLSDQRTERGCQWTCEASGVPNKDEATRDGARNVQETVPPQCGHGQEAAKETGKERGTGHRVFPVAPPLPDRRDSVAHHRHKHHHHRYQFSNIPANRDHPVECKEQRNYFPEVERPENCGCKMEGCHRVAHPVQTSYSSAEPAYVCPYRILDRTHQCVANRSDQANKTENCIYDKPSRHKDHVSRFLKYRFYSSNPKEDLLNLNFDLCDLVPEEKFDWESFHQHRRSKSYDLYDKKFPNNFMGSPKAKPKQFRNEDYNILSKADLGGLPTSPNHHYRHRNRERERQRAMQQVANWIEKEHLRGFDREEGIYASPLSSRRSQMMAERHEHHHLHEHVHHHYHHYVDA